MSGARGRDWIDPRRIAVRVTELSDAEAIARAHVRAWQAAYRGTMPDEYLDALRVQDRLERWRAILSSSEGENWHAVVTVDGAVQGFCTVGEGRGEPSMSELWGINIDPDVFATGAGQALLDATHAELDRRPQPRSMLWVVEDNARARRFYERNDWCADGESKVASFGGREVRELRYVRTARPR